MMADAKPGGGTAQRQALAIFLGREIAMDAIHPARRRKNNAYAPIAGSVYRTDRPAGNSARRRRREAGGHTVHNR
jgi:hypothetical protein